MRLILTSLLIASLSFTAPSQASDGKELHADQCTRCHDTSVYTRENRRVTSKAGLDKQVRRCTTMLGVQWFDDEVNAVADYLNSNYYKF